MKIKLSLLLALIFLLPNLAVAQSAIIYYEQGQNAFSAQNYFEAAENFRSALAINPSYASALLALAAANFYLGEYHEAISQLNAHDRLSRSVQAQTLRGRSYVALGRGDEARAIFEQVLAQQPNNLDALFGMTEVQLLAGRIDIAINDITNLLRIVPDNRRALLSLTLLYSQQGDARQAELFLNQALFYYPQDVVVLYVAGNHFRQNGNWQQALHHFSAVAKINPNYADVRERQAEALIGLNRLDEAALVLEDLIRGRGRSNANVWATLAEVFTRQRDFAMALRAYSEAVRLAPNDELIRFATEELLRALPFDVPERNIFADERLARGNRLAANFDYQQALREFRWALLLAPDSAVIRQAFGRQLGLLGAHFSHIDQLRLIRDEGQATQLLLDTLATLERRNIRSVASDWGFRSGPHNNDTRLYIASLNGGTAMHRQGDNALVSRVFIRYLERHTRFTLIAGGEQANFTEAWRNARAVNSDFFIITSFKELDRSFYGSYTLYLTATGSQLASFSHIRSTASKVDETLTLLSDSLNEVVPVSGRILRRNGQLALINLGRLNGLNVGDELLVVRAGQGRFISSEPFFEYLAQDLLGTLTVTALDEFVAEAGVQSATRNDIIAQEDVLFLIRANTIRPQAAVQLTGIPQGFLLIH
ncbi:MAG: tetratricopeptide repeat protein [Spirochaetaceae bacterium]|nr:tetratricopeptide repeat protein [Spirochaetaceae bacterium]